MMNQEQRQYTIKKIEKNTEKITKLNIGAKAFAFSLGVGVLGVALFSSNFDLAYVASYDTTTKIEFIIKYLLCDGLAVVSLKNMVNNLAQKAGLEVMNEQLEYALSMDSLESGNQLNDNEKEKGRTR